MAVPLDLLKCVFYAAVPNTWGSDLQASRAFLEGVRELLPESVPILSVSKGIEKATGKLLSDVIPAALQRAQPAVFLSGPSFAKEVRHPFSS